MRDGAEIYYRYTGTPHGITNTHKEQLGSDLLEFLSSSTRKDSA